MNIEVITIGDELLSGETVETNSHWIAGRLWDVGGEVRQITTVRDDAQDIGGALHSASGSSQLVIVTGGLGPTTDDITLESAARAFGLPLKLNERALGGIRAAFQRIGRPMSPNNEKQAMLPEGSQMIPNQVGTAPGCHLTYKGTDFFFLPGVPKEMKQQFDEGVLPQIQKVLGGKAPLRKVFRCFGLAEASLDQELRSIDFTGVRLGWQVVFPEVLVKIATGDPQILTRVESAIRGKIGKWIYAEGEETIERLIGRLLKEKKETVAIAESCTGGLIQNLITDVPGSSGYFRGGVVSYSDDLKVDFLGIDPRLIQSKGAVSSEIARAMAEGVRKRTGSTYGIAVTGIAGPSGGTKEKPVGTVHIAVAGPKGTEEEKYFFPHNREWFKLLAAHTALHQLLKIICDS